MIVIVSGEGPSDMGACTNQQGMCKGGEFRAGPMAVLVDKLLEQKFEYPLLASTAMEFVSEGVLAGRSRQLPMVAAGKKRGYETAYHFKGAWALARLAKERIEEMGCPVGAVLFRDCDGTRSAELNRFETIWDSIVSGFAIEDFPHGVPMVPKPKSEAWIICALKDAPYQHCGALEERLSGNDHAPESAKAQLGVLLAARGREVGHLSEMVESGEIDPLRIDMPSYKLFCERLMEVAGLMRSA